MMGRAAIGKKTTHPVLQFLESVAIYPLGVIKCDIFRENFPKIIDVSIVEHPYESR